MTRRVRDGLTAAGIVLAGLVVYALAAYGLLRLIVAVFG